MKTIIGALALTLAVPAFAQTAPAADPHAQHQTRPAPAGAASAGQHEAGKHDCKACCEKMMGKDDGMMGRMGTKADGNAPAQAGQQTHQGQAR